MPAQFRDFFTVTQAYVLETCGDFATEATGWLRRRANGIAQDRPHLLLHAAAVLCSEHAKPSLNIVLQIADHDLCHDATPDMLSTIAYRAASPKSSETPKGN